MIPETMTMMEMMTIIKRKINFSIFVCSFSAILLLLACTDKDDPTLPEVTASGELFQIISDTDSTYLTTSNRRGNIYVEQMDSIVTMTINLTGFTPNTVHAIHMHHGSCAQPKHHWNAGSTESFCNEKSLGYIWSKPFAGDVGNLSVGYDSTGTMTISTDLWRLGSGDQRDILGLQVVIHENMEDFSGECDPMHGGGHTHFNAKIACGTIL
jgi:Cu-Zn family superoxide dismutase